jgi:hypothetical protein
VQRKTVVAAVAAPMVLWTMMWGVGHIGRKTDPVEQAIAKMAVQNPDSIRAQVDLTKETLKSMGLDPGKAGDVGCLTQQ